MHGKSSGVQNSGPINKHKKKGELMISGGKSDGGRDNKMVEKKWLFLCNSNFKTLLSQKYLTGKE